MTDPSSEKVDLRLEFATGQPLMIKVDPHWLRDLVMTNQWCSVGEGADEVWINGAHVVTVSRVIYPTGLGAF